MNVINRQGVEVHSTEVLVPNCTTLRNSRRGALGKGIDETLGFAKSRYDRRRHILDDYLDAVTSGIVINSSNCPRRH